MSDNIITVSHPNAAEILTEAVRAAQPVLSERALADCNRYCRMWSGKLAESGKTCSDLKSGTLVWKAPYARLVYYTGEPSRKVNPRAVKMWAHKAADIHFLDWKKYAADFLFDEFGRRTNGA